MAEPQDQKPTLDNFFYKKAGFLKLNNHGGHSSFVFPHLCLAKSKVCLPYDIIIPKKKDFLNLCRI